MKVLFQARINYNKAIAGDSVQIDKTREYLQKIGADVTIHNAAVNNLKDFDIIHLFNIMPVTETYGFFQDARRQKIPVVLSTIYWDPAEFLKESDENGKFGLWWRETMPQRREILNGVRYILPNSKMELDSLKKDFGVLPPAYIIPNAADKYFAFARPERFIRKYRMKDFILGVGRICKRKNQLRLIQAAKRLKLPLVLIGPLNDSSYYRECRQESAGYPVTFIDTLNHHELASAYAAARVHALVSWYDTPGLVSLEAALAGCVIVSTNRGCTREYLEDLAHYCDPGDVGSIMKAVQNAWETKNNNRLRDRVLRDFTWEKAAAATFAVYQKILTG